MNPAPTPAPGELWRGQSMETRAAERRSRLLAAGLDLMGTVGSAQATLRAVCRMAGVSLRYFYESFPDLNALQIAVYDDVANALTREVLSRIASAPDTPHDRAEAAFGSAVDFIDADPRRGRILFRETLADDALREHGAATVPQFVALVLSTLSGDTPDREPTSGHRHGLQVSALSGALVMLFLDRESGALQVPKQELVDYCCELALSVSSSENRPKPSQVKTRSRK